MIIFDIFDDLKCYPVKLNNKPITSLMYADDLLILSETEDGLKESLQRLGKYAEQWKMKISAKKTKIMVFNKQGRKSDMKVKLYYIILSPIFVITKWAALLVDIHCPRGGS